jgi:hypothetical protein
VIVTDPVADVPVMLTVIPVSVETAVRDPPAGVPVQVSWADAPVGGGVTGAHGAEPPAAEEVLVVVEDELELVEDELELVEVTLVLMDV